MILLYSTCKNLDIAKKLAFAALDQNLAICVNIFPQGISLYKWQGKLCEENEIYLLFKTNEENSQKLQNLLLELHEYEVPALIRIEAKALGKFAKLFS